MAAGLTCFAALGNPAMHQKNEIHAKGFEQRRVRMLAKHFFFSK
jgi:hypothetical protein